MKPHAQVFSTLMPGSGNYFLTVKSNQKLPARTFSFKVFALATILHAENLHRPVRPAERSLLGLAR